MYLYFIIFVCSIFWECKLWNKLIFMQRKKNSLRKLKQKQKQKQKQNKTQQKTEEEKSNKKKQNK